MPSIRDLERFQESFKAIGGESAAGETYEALALPAGGGLDADLASLLNINSDSAFGEMPSAPGSAPIPANGTEAGGVAPAGNVGADFDFSAFLDSIPLESEASPLPELDLPPETAAAPESGMVDDFGIPEDLLSGFASEMESTPPDAAALFDLPSSDEAAPMDVGPAKSDSAAGEDEFSDFDLNALTAFEQNFPETKNEAATPVPAPAEAEPSSLAASDDFNDLDLSLAETGTEEETFDLSVLEFGDIPTAAEPPRDSQKSAKPVEVTSFTDTLRLDEELLEAGYGPKPKPSTGKAEPQVDNLEDYSLAGIDEAFRGASAETPTAAAFAMPVAAETVEEINLTDDDFENLQNTLSSYPLNLRIACEELIAEHAVPPDQMSAFIKDLVRGLGASAMAEVVGRLIGHPIVVPRGFEKRSGEELEAEKSSFTYIFIHKVLPPLSVFGLIAAVVASLVYLGIEFVYRPLRAESFYRQGYERIPAGDYSRANEHFNQGFQLWRSKNWFYRYAEAFAAEERYLLAEEKYDQLLNWYPRDHKGALDYAALETYSLLNYEKADGLLRRKILDYEPDDREGLLALGDTNLEWGGINPTRYEEARKAYARLIGVYGSRDEYLERMLKYFIRTDALAEVLPLQAFFLSSDRRKIAGASLAELGGYLLDRKTETVVGVPDPLLERIENIKETLLRALAADPAWPETYYHLSRYYERYGTPAEELEVTGQALDAFAAAKTGTAKRDAAWVDTYRRIAALYRDQQEYLLAERYLKSGIALYEDRKTRKILKAAPEYGRLYADLGDLDFYLAGDLPAAARLYGQADQEGWNPPDLRYRVGYIYYRNGDWGKATEKFFSAASDFVLNRRVLFALGNAAYLRGDLWASEGYYNRLLELLETDRSRFPLLLPNDNPEHAELAERLMRGRNNLGVALGALADATGEIRFRSQALALFAESARAWDALTRDPVTLARSEAVNLSFLNSRNVLRPEDGYEAQIYREIDKDINEPSAWEALLDR